MPINHDVAWTLWLAQQVLAGRELYRDILEINPPLIVWLNLPIVQLADALSVSPYLLFYIALFALLCVCAAMAIRLLPVRPAGAGLLLAFVLGPLAGADLGQRDHICVALLLPILALAVRRKASPGAVLSRGATPAAGLLAGVALSLKPFLTPVWLLLILYRRLALEDFIVVAAGVLYVVCVIFFTPDYLPLTRTLMETYSAFNQQTWTAMLIHPEGASLLLVAAAWVYLARRGLRSRMVAVCLLAAVGAWVGAVIQRKGWGYHWYPATAFTVLAVMAIYRASLRASRTADAHLVRPTRVASYLVAAVSLVVAGRFFVAVEYALARRASIRLLSAVSHPGERVLVLSSRVSDAWPAVPLAGAQWAARVPALWFAQAEGIQPPPRMRPGERLLYNTLIEDLLSEPERLIVETPELNAHRLRRPGFDPLAYLRQDSRAAAALAHYRETQRVQGMSVWVRQ